MKNFFGGGQNNVDTDTNDDIDDQIEDFDDLPEVQKNEYEKLWENAQTQYSAIYWPEIAADGDVEIFKPISIEENWVENEVNMPEFTPTAFSFTRRP